MADGATYFAALPERLAAHGFALWTGAGPGAGEWAVFHRRKVSLTKLAKVDTFAAVCAWEPCPPSATVRAASERVYRWARANKSKLPRGLGGLAVAYTVVVASSAPPDVAALVSTYVPRHFGSSELVAVVELDRDTVLRCEKRPLWAGAYHRGFRTELAKLFGP